MTKFKFWTPVNPSLRKKFENDEETYIFKDIWYRQKLANCKLYNLIVDDVFHIAYENGLL